MNASDRRAPGPSAGEAITGLLHAAQEGQRDAADALLRAVYAELKTIALARVRHLRAGQTLGPTALVHEAYEKLFRDGEARFQSRAHFFGAASQAMRDLLVDYARHKAARKRGGDQVRVPEEDMHELPLALDLPVEDLLALDDALRKMSQEHPRKAEIVMLRYFAGLTEDEIAELSGVTTRTVERDWRFAKAWLYRALHGGDEPAP
ncbi:ECF-type sigma factor [Sorangium sp. So ce295]|jgi:RNA polymerase sigma factor (TIGR02999 family)|uniref:ECF-type sigma factor n=1 Tax=Sorangium sp. So ce295 TaxID=3133295 RepID=UPI003F62CCC9